MMKVKFSDTVAYIPSWNGNEALPPEEQIKCDLEVLDMASLMALVDSFGRAGLSGEVDTEQVDTKSIAPIVAQFSEILPNHIKNLSGLYNAAGEAVGVDGIVKYPYFLNLCLELLMKLSEISSPGEEDVKN